MALDAIGDIANPNLAEGGAAPDLVWETAADWDAAADEYAVAHESVSNTDRGDDTIVVMGTSYSNPPLDNLLADMPCDEDTTGTVHDVSGNGNDVTNFTGGPTPDQPGINGETGWDVTSGYWDHDAPILPTGGDFSAIIWFYPDTWSADDSLISTRDNGISTSVGMDLWYVGGLGGLNARFYDGGGTDAGNADPSLGTWHLAAARFDDSVNEGDLWIDGATDETVSTTYNGSSASNMRIGDWANGGGKDFAGTIDHYWITNDYVTNAELDELYDAVFGSPYLESATKSYASPQEPDISDVQYTLNGESITLKVIGSPGGGSEETETVVLDGSSSFTLTWANSHTDFRIRIEPSTSTPTTSPTFDSVTLSG